MSAASHPLLRAVLGVLAAWSVVVLVAVEGGLGGRWSLHPDAALDTSAIPEVNLVSGVGGVQGFDEYASIVQRPLFREDRRPAPPPADSEEEQAGAAADVPLSVVVTSIVITGERKMVIVTDPQTNRSQTVSVGAALEGDQSAWRLTELEPRRAVFEGPGGRSTMDLRVFDGQGGEPPTPIGQAGAPRGGNEPQAAAEAAGENKPDEAVRQGNPDGSLPESAEARAEQIRRRIEERRRQMREEAERRNAERGQ